MQTAPNRGRAEPTQDARGNSFDTLDRGLSKYEASTGSAAQNTSIYDCNGDYGLVCQTTNAMSQTKTLSYDAAGHLSSETFNDGTPGRSYTYDPDGRVVSIQQTGTGNVGTVTRTYDQDGRLTQSTTPSGVSGNGTITYSYYGDGMRSQLGLSVPGGNFNQPNLFQYSYRADGLRSSLKVNGTSTGTFAWAYSNAGREQQETDPLTGTTSADSAGLGTNVKYVPLGYTYDGYGRISGETLPRSNFAYSGFNYDVDGGIVSYVSPLTGQYKSDLTVRNEVASTTSPDGKSVYSNRFANGAQCSVPMLYRQPAPSCVMDSRSNLLISNDSTENTNSGSTNQYTESWDTAHQIGYDLAGRQITDTSQTCSVTQSTDSAFPVAQAPKITSTRTYDADNHLTGQTIPVGYEPTANDCTTLVSNPTYTSAMSFGYTWGPMGIWRKSRKPRLAMERKRQRLAGMATICSIRASMVGRISRLRSWAFSTVPTFRSTIGIGPAASPTCTRQVATRRCKPNRGGGAAM